MNADREKLFAYLLRLGDNAVILAQQLGDWVGKGPELEEEMAMANFALDYVGQARLFYSLAAEIEGQSRTEDDLAFLRDGMDFHNLLLVEQPNGDFAMTIARQFYFEGFYDKIIPAVFMITPEENFRYIAIKVAAGEVSKTEEYVAGVWKRANAPEKLLKILAKFHTCRR